MKKIIILLSLINNILLAQNISYTLSNTFESLKDKRNLNFVTVNNNIISSCSYSKKEGFLYLQYFHKDSINAVHIKKIALPGTKTAFIKQFKQDVYCFYTTLEDKTGILHVIPFNKGSMTLNEKDISLIEANPIGKGKYYGEFDLSQSIDSSNILINYYKVPPARTLSALADYKDVYGFFLCDNKLKQKYANPIEMPYVFQNNYNSPQSFVDSKGNIFFLSLTNSFNQFYYHLFKINKQNNILQEIKLDLDDKYNSGIIRLFENYNHEVFVTGQYTKIAPPTPNENLLKRPPESTDGVFLMKLEVNGDNPIPKPKVNFYEFPTEIVKLYTNKAWLKEMDRNGDLEIEFLYQKDVVFNKDGSILFFNERGKVLCQEIMVTKINRDGSLAWCHKIPKMQHAKFESNGTTSYVSFYHHQKGFNDYFFYYDNIKNLDLEPTKMANEYGAGGKGYLACVKIDQNGTLTKSKVFETKDIDEKISPAAFQSINEHLILYKIDDSKILKIELN
jgi:hypothetical protein